MKVSGELLQHLHLNKNSLLTARNIKFLLEFFYMLDIHHSLSLNDIQFTTFMKSVTNVKSYNVDKIFDLFDVDNSGELDFDEFYLLVGILISIKDGDEKEFIYRHCDTVFELMDADGSGNLSATEFENFGLLFGFDSKSVRELFQEYDVSGDQNLEKSEFRMFAMACVDKQNTQEVQHRERNAMRRLQKTAEDNKRLIETIKEMDPKAGSEIERELQMAIKSKQETVNASLWCTIL